MLRRNVHRMMILALVWSAGLNYVQATIHQGDCGQILSDVHWSLNTETGVMTISGSGAMVNTWSLNTVPWAAYKDSITSVEVNSGVTSIGQYAFAQCPYLQSVSLPEGLTAIRSYVFRECSSLTSITIPNSVTLIGTEAFRSTPLDDIYVSWTSTISSIPTWSSMTDKEASSIKLHIPCGTSANYLAKNGWNKYALRSDCAEEYTLTVQSHEPTLGKVQIDDGEVGVSASLQVKKDETHLIKAIANDACHTFSYWNDGKNDNPRSVAINANTTYTAYFADRNTKSGKCGTYATWELSCDSVLTISGTGAIQSQAFQSKNYSSAIKHVIIEEGIESIETNAFNGCANLVSVKNPSSLKSIRDYAFMNCQKLDTINFPEGLITIGNYPNSDGHTFYECNSLRSIHIPASVTNISKDCFLRCYSVTSIIVDPANTKYDSRDNCNAIIEKANNKLWYGCRNTVIPDGVVTVSQYAFEYQHNLRSIRISNTVTSFGYYVFKECENLKDIYVEWTENIPNYVITQWQQHLNLDHTIRVHVPCGKAALYEANYYWNKFQIVDDHVKGGMCGAQGANLTWMLDCSGVLTISGTGEMANWAVDAACPWFSYRAQIYTINIADGVTTIGNKAFVFSKISSITIPNSVTSIGSEAFRLSNNLEEIILPEGLNSIGNYAFRYGNVLKIVHIPSTVTSLGAGAFAGCDLLTDIYVSWSSSIPGWPSNFSKTYGVNLHVPCGTETLYEAADGWNSYTTIVGSGDMASGTCGASGDNLTWTLSCDSVLTISGTGAMANYPALNMPWKDYRTSIKSVIISDGVTTIGNSAFQGCSNLRSLTVPPSLTTVGQNAFTSCWAMESVYISDLTAWCNITFGTYDSSPFCRNGYAIHVGGGDLYVNGTKVTTLTIPDGITEIKNDAFYGFAGITDIQFNQVTTIGNSAFNGCHGLTSVTLPEGVTTIGQYGICYCSHLQSISIPASASSLGTSMVRANPALTDIYVHWTENIPTWPEYFTNKNPQTNITLHVPCAAVDLYEAADGWNGYTIAANDIASGTCGASGDNLTWTLSCDSVLTISGTGPMIENMFSGSPWASKRLAIKSVIIEDGVTSIGWYAFENCKNLRSVSIPNSVTKMGFYAFQNCSTLTSVTIPNGVTRIKGSTFRNCIALTEVHLSNNCDSIGDYVFENCKALTSVTIPSSVIFMGVYTFNKCTALSSVTFENGVKMIGRYAFGDCSALPSVTIPGSVTTISNYAFRGCSAMASVTIEEGVDTIGQQAFYKCSALQSVTIPSSVTSIRWRAFYDCNALSDIYVSWTETAQIPSWEDITSKTPISSIRLHVPCVAVGVYKEKPAWKEYTIVGGDVASGTCGAAGNEANVTWTLSCDSVLTISGTGEMKDYSSASDSNLPWKIYQAMIKSVVIEAGVTKIGNYAFANCSKLASVTIASSVTSIGVRAFANCANLKFVTIPSTVATLGQNMFYSSGITDLYLEWTSGIPNRPSNFTTDYTPTLHVPCEAIDLYRAKDGWKSYSKIKGDDVTYTVTVETDNPSMGIVDAIIL